MTKEQTEEQAKLEKLAALVEIKEELAIKAVLVSLAMQREFPGWQVLSVRPDPSAAKLIESKRGELTLADFELWRQTFEGRRAAVMAKGMSREMHTEMVGLAGSYARRAALFFEDSIRCDEFEAGEGGPKYGQAEMYVRAQDAAIRAGIRPRDWHYTSHCEMCGTMPAPTHNSRCMWCETFRELYEEIGSGDSKGPRVTENRTELEGDTAIKARAGEVNEKKEEKLEKTC